MSSLTEGNQKFFNFRCGDIVDAYGEIAVILDVLRSEYTDNICIYVRFVRNMGNSRPYDMLEVSPKFTKGVDKWKPATMESLKIRISEREKYFNQEINELLEIVNSYQAISNNGNI